MNLVEVMIVIAIVVTLMSILGYGAWEAYQDSLVQMTALQLGQVAEQVQIAEMKGQRAPDLAAVYGARPVPTDGWGNAIVLIRPGLDGRTFELVSYGADGVEGGEGRDADVLWSRLQR